MDEVKKISMRLHLKKTPPAPPVDPEVLEKRLKSQQKAEEIKKLKAEQALRLGKKMGKFHVVLNYLVKAYPNCFYGKYQDRKPISTKMYHILRRVSREIPVFHKFMNHDGYIFLKWYVCTPNYWLAVIRSEKRIDLEGNECEDILPVHKIFSYKKLRQYVKQLKKKNKEERLPIGEYKFLRFLEATVNSLKPMMKDMIMQEKARKRKEIADEKAASRSDVEA